MAELGRLRFSLHAEQSAVTDSGTVFDRADILDAFTGGHTVVRTCGVIA